MRGVVSHMVGQVADFSIRLPQRLGCCCPLVDIELDVAQQAL
jgi:hypothetical protein